MKKYLLSAVALLTLATVPAFAIDNVVSTPQRVATYSATVSALTPAASTTDFLTIRGSATKTVRVKSIVCTGASTADGTSLIPLIRRSAVDTGGTAATATAVPLDTQDVPATAVVSSYTANPSGLGTTVGTVTIGTLATPVLATSAGAKPMVLNFGESNTKELTLRGATQVVALNHGGVSFVAGASLSCTVTWTEGGS